MIRMIPSSEQVAENIRKQVDALALEIARRVACDHSGTTHETVHRHAVAVLLDWLLGDLVPNESGR